MRTIEINLYKFEELSEETQQKVLEKLWDLNVDYDWWQYIYEDAERIGLKINGFDIDRGNYCNGEFILNTCEVAQNVFNEHGEKCDTYKTASNFMENWQPVFNDYMNESSEHYESEESEDTLSRLDDEFLKDILEDYLKMLRGEYEYLTEEKQIIEIIKANDYEFDSEGNIS